MVQLPLHLTVTREPDSKLLHLTQRLEEVSTFFWWRTTTSDLEDLTSTPAVNRSGARWRPWLQDANKTTSSK